MKSITFAAALIASVSAWNGHGHGYGAVHGGRAGYGGYGGNAGYGYGTYAKVTPVAKTFQVQPAKESNKASEHGYAGAKMQQYKDWDAYGRDQDLSIDESYGKTGAKSYKAESYDQWDNKDNDGWGGQAWGTDKDAAHASSQAYAASAGDKARAAASYGGHAHGYGHGYGYGGPGYGAGYGHGYGGYGKSYGASAAHGAQAHKASVSKAAQADGYDNDAGPSRHMEATSTPGGANLTTQLR